MPDLGKYAIEVLSAYGVSLFLVAALVLLTLRRGAHARAALRQMEEETARNGKG
ncbi:heme exporter protein CcmD [uncultured Sulfitobacter sp.]|uniref:heme exporter protein CcmD n=1 Tax=uncultured Sulfitobacter sp. TaxID=191468 RepID=UPI0026119AFE|nr:heme exporter protein CcmD [uncultured Sulfitobacter sp.]